MPTAVAPPMPMFPVHRFTVDQYHRMIQANILNEDDNVELLEGYIVPKMPRGDDHDTAIEQINHLLARLVPQGSSYRCQCALTLADSEPEPDFVVCTPSKVRGGKHPRPADTFVVVEVSDSTLYLDRTVRHRVYARAGIPVYWIVNLEDRQVEVYTDPVTPPTGDPHYRTRADYKPGQDVPLTVAGAPAGTVAVDALLP
jgi:Uma2 family endonuclease